MKLSIIISTIMLASIGVCAYIPDDKSVTAEKLPDIDTRILLGNLGYNRIQFETTRGKPEKQNGQQLVAPPSPVPIVQPGQPINPQPVQPVQPINTQPVQPITRPPKPAQPVREAPNPVQPVRQAPQPLQPVEPIRQPLQPVEPVRHPTPPQPPQQVHPAPQPIQHIPDSRDSTVSFYSLLRYFKDKRKSRHQNNYQDDDDCSDSDDDWYDPFEDDDSDSCDGTDDDDPFYDYDYDSDDYDFRYYQNDDQGHMSKRKFIRHLLDKERLKQKFLFQELRKLTNSSVEPVREVVRNSGISMKEAQKVSNAWYNFYKLFSPLKDKLLVKLQELEHGAEVNAQSSSYLKDSSKPISSLQRIGGGSNKFKSGGSNRNLTRRHSANLTRRRSANLTRKPKRPFASTGSVGLSANATAISNGLLITNLTNANNSSFSISGSFSASDTMSKVLLMIICLSMTLFVY